MPVVRTGCSHWLDKTVVQVSSLMDNGCSELVDEIKPRWLSQPTEKGSGGLQQNAPKEQT